MDINDIRIEDCEDWDVSIGVKVEIPYDLIVKVNNQLDKYNETHDKMFLEKYLVQLIEKGVELNE